jgi:hypothetical protein
VAWNVGSLLWIFGPALDKFSTYEGLGDFWKFWAEGEGFGRGSMPVPGMLTRPNHGRRFAPLILMAPVRLRASSTPASEKRARRGPRLRRCAQGRLWKSGPDADLIPAIPGRREAKASASRNPGSQNRAPGQPAMIIRSPRSQPITLPPTTDAQLRT